MDNSSAVIPFQFQSTTVRTITKDGEPWFVAKDICDVLEIQNVTQALDSLEGDERSMFNIGRQGEANIISESGLYALIFKSRKPEAKTFRKWVTSEVLPAIRKTGKYASPSSTARRKGPRKWGAEELSTAALAAEFRAFRSFALAAGLKGNPATISADTAVRRVYGVSPLNVMQIELQSEQHSQLYTPTQIAENTGARNARAVNRLLERCGLQEKLPSGEWRATKKGEQCSVMLDTGKRHSNGTMIRQIKWTDKALDIVKNALADGTAN